MCVAVVGGMDRLRPHYEAEAQKFGVVLKVFNGPEKGIAKRIGEMDAIVLFTGKISHKARREVMAAARRREIPVVMCHSCGLCTLRTCLEGFCQAEPKGSQA